MSSPQPGSIIAGKYQLRRLLGQGGYGSVFEGENVDIGKKVAIKLIDARHKGSNEAIRRFRREARIAGRIESPHIVQVFDVGEDEALGLYMVMELLRGEDLRHKLDRVQRVDVEFAVLYAQQIATGLAKAHVAGVVHRDLKPANVFLHEGDGESPTVVKIVDFGVAKLIEGEGTGGMTNSGQPLTTAGKTMGTPQYMAPEQVQGLEIDHRGDVWALGALLYEMLSGRYAYPLKATFMDTALAIVRERPPPLAEVAPWVPGEVVAVVERALEHDLTRRIPDMTAFAEMLVAACPRAFPPRESDRNPPAPQYSSGQGARSSAPAPTTNPSDQVEAIPLVTARRTSDEELPTGRRRTTGIVVFVVTLLAAGAILGVAALRAREKQAQPETTTEPHEVKKKAVALPAIDDEPGTPAPSASAPTPKPSAKKPQAKPSVDPKPSAESSIGASTTY